jgi:hypothetical protein
MKCHKGDEAQMKVECRWNSNFELLEEKGSHRKFVGEILAWIM